MTAVLDRNSLCAAGAVALPGATAAIATMTLPPGTWDLNIVTFATTPDVAKTADMQLMMNGTLIGLLLSMGVAVPTFHRAVVRAWQAGAGAPDSGIVTVRSSAGSASATYAAAIVAIPVD